MSDQPFFPPQVPLMTAEKARDLARIYRAMAEYLEREGLPMEARINEQHSQRWLTYSIALAAQPPKSV